MHKNCKIDIYAFLISGLCCCYKSKAKHLTPKWAEFIRCRSGKAPSSSPSPPHSRYPSLKLCLFLFFPMVLIVFVVWSLAINKLCVALYKSSNIFELAPQRQNHVYPAPSGKPLFWVYVSRSASIWKIRDFIGCFPDIQAGMQNIQRDCVH